eukprot:6473220-Amphidinium_carterae.1
MLRSYSMGWNAKWSLQQSARAIQTESLRCQEHNVHEGDLEANRTYSMFRHGHGIAPVYHKTDVLEAVCQAAQTPCEVESYVSSLWYDNSKWWLGASIGRKLGKHAADPVFISHAQSVTTQQQTMHRTAANSGRGCVMGWRWEIDVNAAASATVRGMSTRGRLQKAPVGTLSQLLQCGEHPRARKLRPLKLHADAAIAIPASVSVQDHVSSLVLARQVGASASVPSLTKL